MCVRTVGISFIDLLKWLMPIKKIQTMPTNITGYGSLQILPLRTKYMEMYFKSVWREECEVRESVTEKKGNVWDG